MTEKETSVPTTVTYLKMEGRPSHPPPPRPLLRTAIMLAENPTTHFYRYLYNTIGRDYVWVDRRKWSDEKLAANIGEGVELYVLHVSGVPAGMAELDFREADECTLAYFGLMPEFIGRGAGPWFLHQAIEIAWQKPITKLLVNTNTLDHPRALATYQRAGFEPFAREERNIMVPGSFETPRTQAR
jgi:GNAT superfamily N-acetyltransferase